MAVPYAHVPIGVALVGLFLTPLGAQEWWTTKDGADRRNAQATTMAGPLVEGWRLRFEDPPRFPLLKSPKDLPVSGSHHARNLVVTPEGIALLASPTPRGPTHLVLCDPSTGTVRASAPVRVGRGNRGMRGTWPAAPIWNGADAVHGATGIAYDPSCRTYFLAAPGDGCSHSAYRWNGTALVPAYADLMKKAPGVVDAFGVPRSAQVTRQNGSDAEPTDFMDAWGLDLAHQGTAIKSKAAEDALRSMPGWNRAVWMAPAPDLPILVTAHSTWHTPNAMLWFWNTHTGLGMATSFPKIAVFKNQGAAAFGPQGRLFGVGSDVEGWGSAATFLANPKPSQGLRIWGLQVTGSDAQTGDGVTGLAGMDTVTVTTRFEHVLKSTGKHAESYVELDGFYREKIVIPDGDGVYTVWKPSRAEPLELVRADPTGVVRVPLGIGQGRDGAACWLSAARTTVAGRDLLVVYAGNADHRERQGEGKEATWGDLRPPQGPAEFAVIDLSTPRKPILSGHHALTDPAPTPNVFYGYVQRSRMTVTGSTAWIAWVAENSLQVTSVDLSAETLKPQHQVLPLGFSAPRPRSVLVDLVPTATQILALVLESDTFDVHDPVWNAQHLIGLRPR